MTPIALTIAGSDSGGGAGIQADLKTFAANGVYCVTAITCLTAQNPDSVTQVVPVEAGFLVEQMLQADRFFKIGAAKTGMLFSADLIVEVARFARERPNLPVVVDPVMVSTSGAVLLKPEAVKILREELLPLAAVITPNLDEAGVLLGRRPDRNEMKDAAGELAKLFGKPILLKGGHLGGARLVDVLAQPNAGIELFEDDRIENVDTHGSGCTLSAAIAARLARGADLAAAVREARAYLRRALQRPVDIGTRRFINHSV